MVVLLNIVRVIGLFVALSVLPACSATVGLVAYDPPNDEVGRGSVTMSFVDGTGTVQVVGEKGGIKAAGPAFYSQGTGANRGGTAALQAEDGRLFKAEWVTRTISSGFGSGTDQFGNPFIFAFGLSEKEEAEFIAKQRQLHQKPADKQ